MTGMKVVPFFLVISLMISSSQALDVFLTDGIGDFSYVTGIDTRSETVAGKVVKHYVGCSKNDTFKIESETTLVIVYIKPSALMDNTQLGVTHVQQRKDIAKKLLENKCQLLYLAIERFRIKTEKGVIGDFLRAAIKRKAGTNQIFQIVTIGYKDINVIYGTSPNELKQYNQGEHITGYNLLSELQSMDAKK